jgi:hypothetical protein
MKQHLTAIAFNEKELESYVSQLRNGGFEAVSDVKKSEDGTFYQALAKTVRQDATASLKPAATIVTESLAPQA